MATMKKNSSAKTKKSANNLLFCLRPAVVERGGSGRGEPAVVTYVAAAAAAKKKERAVAFPKVLPANDMSLEEEKKGSRRFSRVWKAVLSEPSTGRKIKKGKLDKKSPKSRSVESARYDYQERPKDQDQDNFDFGQRIISRSVSALATSSPAVTPEHCPTCSSSLTKSKLVEPDSTGPNKTTIGTNPSHDENYFDQKSQSQRQSDSNKSSNRGLFFMLLSLLVLVLWGKLCAIFWTSTWLFLVPRWTVNDGRVDFSSRELKKVVMGGLLGRERGRFPCQ